MGDIKVRFHYMARRLKSDGIQLLVRLAPRNVVHLLERYVKIWLSD